MKTLNLPHTKPINFAKYIYFVQSTIAHVNIKFDEIPTLPMLVEAAAQSSAAFSHDENKMGFLVSLKNIKLLENLKSLEYKVQIHLEHQLDSLVYFSFEVFDEEKLVANGLLVIMIKK